MSHFTVYAATRTPNEEELNELMLPYNEYECTGDTTYCQYINVSAITAKELEEHNRDNPADRFTVEEWLDCEYHITSDHIYKEEPELKPECSYAVVRDGKIVAVYNFTNPNSKWDYYTPLSWLKRPYIKHINEDDNYTILKKDFDIDIFMEARKKNYIDIYRSVKKCLTDDFKTWEICKQEYPIINNARRIYNEQQSINNIKTELGEDEYFDLCFEGTIDEIATQTEEEFTQEKLDMSAPFWAIVLPTGEWVEKGKMGWWAISTDEDKNWKQTWHDAWSKIPDDYYLWRIDCHI